jgi:hypothetical protein
MWHTPDGDRELTGAEAALLKAAVGTLFEHICQEIDREIGGPGRNDG